MLKPEGCCGLVKTGSFLSNNMGIIIRQSMLAYIQPIANRRSLK